MNCYYTSADTISSGDTYSPREILKEVRNFLEGASYKSQVNNQALAHSALILLRTLPTARHAVLEYLGNVFDEAVNNYILGLELDRNVTDSGEENLDSVLLDACGVLHSFIRSHSVAWAPIISSWSLELLGHISSKYSDRRGVPHTGSLNELLQLWMTCKPTKLLIELATECFAQMVGGAPETCVDALLEASVKYTPNFDWVVAHIGSCFPTTIITRVLMCGLRDFISHGNGQGDSDGALEEKIPKMGSVVGILGHLASKHGHDIRNALMKLFQESLKGEGDSVRMTTIPFLLQLASMSPMLLHIMTTDIVKALTPEVLNQLHTQFSRWRQTSAQEYDSLLNLVVHLVMRSDIGASQALDFLLYNATVTKDDVEEGTVLPEPDVQKQCGALITQLLFETQMVVFRKRQGNTNLEVPLLAALSARLPQLLHDMLQHQDRRSDWLQKLICHIILYGGEKLGADTLAEVLATADTWQQLFKFVTIQYNIEVGMSSVMVSAAEKIVGNLHPHKPTDKLRVLKNIFNILHWEKVNDLQMMRSTLKSCLQSHWVAISQLLLHSNLEVAMVSLKVLDSIGIPDNLSSGDLLPVCGGIVALFFRILELSDRRKVSQMVAVCKRCARYLSCKVFVQCVLIRCIIEGAVQRENTALLGGRRDLSTSVSEGQESDFSLVEANKNHGLSLTLLRSHSSVFHDGVIGQGLRRPSSKASMSREMIIRNKQCLVDMLWACSQDQKDSRRPSSSTSLATSVEVEQKHSYGLKVTADMCRTIGTLLVELSTPDVLYNNRFWPEEESLRMTVERDLLVWKWFDDNPVMWDVLEMYSGNTLIMCRCSPVLRSLTATLMHYFETSREKSARNSPKQLECTCHVVRCLGKSGLLPPPLGILSELFPLISSHEAYLLLLSIWRYMKENPPTEDPDEVSRRMCEPRHTELVRAIVHKNIEKTGDIYGRLFAPPPPVQIPLD